MSEPTLSSLITNGFNPSGGQPGAASQTGGTPATTAPPKTYSQLPKVPKAPEHPDYRFAPQINAQIPEATGGLGTAMKVVEENLRRNWNMNMGAGGVGGLGAVSDLESQLANKMRYFYGENQFQDLNDRQVLELYRQSFMPDTPAGPEYIKQLQQKYFPNYTEQNALPHGPIPFIDKFPLIGDAVNPIVGDFVGAASAPVLAISAVARQAKLSQIDAAISRAQSAGVADDNPAMQQLLQQRAEALQAVHGATQIAGPSVGAALALFGTGGAAEAIEGSAVGVRTITPALRWVNTLMDAGMKSPGALKVAIKYGAKPALEMGRFMGYFEGIRHAAGGDFAGILPGMWEGFIGGAKSGPFFHAATGGIGSAARFIEDRFPGDAQVALRDEGAQLFKRWTENIGDTIKNLRIDFREDPRSIDSRRTRVESQVKDAVNRMFGGGAETSDGRAFVEHMTDALMQHAEANPELKTAAPRAPRMTPEEALKMAERPADPAAPISPETPSPMPGAEGEKPAAPAVPEVVPDTTDPTKLPDSDLPNKFVDLDGKVKPLNDGIDWKRLKALYNRIDGRVDPKLKEALWRQIQRRWKARVEEAGMPNLPLPESEGVHPPEYRREKGPDGKPSEIPPDPHNPPPTWGQSPLDVVLNLDVPYDRREGPLEATPRYRTNTWADGDLYPRRQRTWRDNLAQIAQSLRLSVEEDKHLVGPDTRPDPGWGTVHYRDTTEDGGASIEDTVNQLNAIYGDRSARIVYKTNRAVGVQLNRELEDHLSRGGTKEGYTQWDPNRNKDVIPMTPELAIRYLEMALRSLGMSDERTAVAMPDGTVRMYTAREYAEAIYDASAQPAVELDPRQVRTAREEWLRDRDHEAALRENWARDATAQYRVPTDRMLPPHIEPPGPPPPPPPPTMAELHQQFIGQIGEPRMNKKGQVIEGIRDLLGKPFKIRTNKDGTAVELGAPNSVLSAAQLNDMISKADKLGIAIERTLNDSPEKRGHIKLLKSLGFVQSGTRDGAIVMRREARKPGTVTPEQAEQIPMPPVVKKRVVGKPAGHALVNSGNVKPGGPAVRPPDGKPPWLERF